MDRWLALSVNSCKRSTRLKEISFFQTSVFEKNMVIVERAHPRLSSS